MTREEAIEVYNGLINTKIKEAFEFFAPELKETEDERIRKHLIEIVETYWGKTTEPGKAADLAWLEKQKEQKKPILFKRDCTDFEIEVHEIIAQARNDSRLNDADVLKQFEEEAAFALMLKANKLMEQKPAELETLGKPMTHEEWAEDYWEHHKFASPNGNDKCDVIQFEHKGFIDFCMAYCVDQKPQDRLVLHDTFGYEKGRQVGQREGVEIVLKTPESYGLYKPAEWSEVELEFRGEKVKVKRPFFRDDNGRGYSTAEQDDEVTWNALRAWAESHGHTPFELYPRTEWSEEDEKMRNLAIEWAETMSDQLNFVDMNPTDFRKIIAWLKALRPSWKPSKEQMTALENVIKCELSAGLHTRAEILAELYEDLKKL